jgi:hypothetical protein
VVIETQKIGNLASLIDAIGAGCSDPSAKGPVVVRLELWTGQIVTASYYQRDEDETPDIECLEQIIADNEVIRPFAEGLVIEGKSFVTETGSDDMVCTLRWEIKQ